LKYGGGDISRSSLVFCCSKDNGAYGGPLLLSSTNTQLIIYFVNVKVISETISTSVHQVLMKIAYTVMGCPWHERTASSIVFLPKTSKGSNPESGRKLEESRVVKE
jgi:hypothetical protein